VLIGEQNGATGPPYWLVVNQSGGWMAVLTIKLASGERVLPIFSHKEQAETFVRLRTSESGWGVRNTGAGELVSVLFGPCASVGRVVLDPLPEIEAAVALGLTGTDRECFVDHLIGRGRSWFQDSWARHQENGTS
jgi:hypothetical protein